MKKTNGDRGITLVALILTILVLIIIASISISAIASKNGIYSKTKQAKENSNISQYEEQIELAQIEIYQRNMKNKKEIIDILELIQERLEKNEKFKGASYNIQKYEKEDCLIITTIEGYVFVVGKERWNYIGKASELGQIPEIKEGDINFICNPTEYTTINVTVKIQIVNEQYKDYKIEYSYDLNNWELYKDEPIIVTENNTTIYARLTNEIVSGKNTVSTTISNIDREDSNIISIEASETDWTNQDVIITAIAQDAGSGIVGYAWTETETEPTNWENINKTTSQITQKNTVSKNVTKYFWTKDGAGNISVASITIDKIDKTAPSAPTISIGNISIKSDKWEYKIYASGSSDSESKIENYEYVLGSSISSLSESSKIVTGTGNPAYTIKVRAKDNAGNYSSYSNAMVLNIERLYIRQLYQALRNNGAASEGEIDGWENNTNNVKAAQIAYGIFTSEEAGELYTNVGKEAMIERIYNGILGRSVDSSGFNTYVSWMTSSNWSDVKKNIITSIVNSPEAQSIYSARGLSTGEI